MGFTKISSPLPTKNQPGFYTNKLQEKNTEKKSGGGAHTSFWNKRSKRMQGVASTPGGASQSQNGGSGGPGTI